MAEEHRAPEITGEMEHLLLEVKRFRFAPPEETLLSIAGRGHLENPTTDLLAYFMQPTNQHEFKASFLQTFFECMKVDWTGLSFDPVVVNTQAQTKDGKRIDLLITGPDWILIIENKLHADLYNPLASYEEHAERFSASKQFFAVLSPWGSVASNWTPVTYKSYCEALRRTLPPTVFNGWTSKWHVFAREFIVHLENEFKYNSTMIMTPDQIAFVEKNFREIEDVKRLSACYVEFLQQELGKRLTQEVPGYEFLFKNSWALLCDVYLPQNVRLQLFFGTPYHNNDWPKDGNIRIGFQMFGREHSGVFDGLNITCHPQSSYDYCECPEVFRHTDDAIVKFCNLVKEVLSRLAN
jgi:hypothetical protein